MNENGYNNIADFIEAHDNALSPEQIEEARKAAHAAGLPFSEKPYRDGDFDPYVFDGSMSAALRRSARQGSCPRPSSRSRKGGTLWRVYGKP